MEKKLRGKSEDNSSTAVMQDDEVRQDNAYAAERWLPVVGFEGIYEVSDHGRVRTVERSVTAGFFLGIVRKSVILVQTTGGRVDNYKRVNLRGATKRRFAYVHHIMAEAFLGPRPEGELVRHLDDDGFHNHISNLAYGTRADNELDRHVAKVAPHLPDAPF